MSLLSAWWVSRLPCPTWHPREFAQDIPDWLPNRQVSLGLDLSGGAHLLLQIDESVYIRDRMNAVESSVRRVLRSARIGVRALGGEGFVRGFTLRRAEDVPDVRSELDGIADDMVIEVLDDGQITITLTEDGLTTGLSDAVERTLEVLRNRIDPDGVLEPVITRQGRDRILVQVPGVDDTRILRSRLGQTAKMTFHMVDTQAGTRWRDKGWFHQTGRPGVANPNNRYPFRNFSSAAKTWKVQRRHSIREDPL